MEKEIPVILKTYDLMVWVFEQTGRFPRQHRFSLGSRIESKLLDLLDLLVEARYTKDKSDALGQANRHLETFRFLMRLAKDLKVISLKAYQYQAEGVEEIGRMIGGWKRSAGKGPAEDLPEPGEKTR